MRTVTYGAAVSLDGFITGPGESIDWIRMSRDAMRQIERYWGTIDTILMGRKTWAFAAGAGGDGGGGAPLQGITTYVFSRTLPEIARPGVRLVRDDAAAFVRELKRQPGKGICVMGGGELARALLEGGVVDEVGLNIHPVLLGGGVPMFPAPGPRVELELAECLTLEGGCVYATYRVRQPAPPRPRRDRAARGGARPGGPRTRSTSR